MLSVGVALQAREQKYEEGSISWHVFSPWQSSSKLGSAHLAQRKRSKKTTIFDYSTERKSAITYEVDERFL